MPEITSVAIWGSLKKKHCGREVRFHVGLVAILGSQTPWELGQVLAEKSPEALVASWVV